MKVYLLVLYWICYQQSPEMQEQQGCNSPKASAEAALLGAFGPQGERVDPGQFDAHEVVWAYYASRKSCEQEMPKLQALQEKSEERTGKLPDDQRRLFMHSGHVRCEEKDLLP